MVAAQRWRMPQIQHCKWLFFSDPMKYFAHMLFKVCESACNRNIQFCLGTVRTHHRLACLREGISLQIKCGSIKWVDILKKCISLFVCILGLGHGGFRRSLGNFTEGVQMSFLNKIYSRGERLHSILLQRQPRAGYLQPMSSFQPQGHSSQLAIYGI